MAVIELPLSDLHRGDRAIPDTEMCLDVCTTARPLQDVSACACECLLTILITQRTGSQSGCKDVMELINTTACFHDLH